MGTNFYLMSRNKKLMREYFAVETEYTIKDIEYEIEPIGNRMPDPVRSGDHQYLH